MSLTKRCKWIQRCVGKTAEKKTLAASIWIFRLLFNLALSVFVLAYTFDTCYFAWRSTPKSNAKLIRNRNEEKTSISLFDSIDCIGSNQFGCFFCFYKVSKSKILPIVALTHAYNNNQLFVLYYNSPITSLFFSFKSVVWFQFFVFVSHELGANGYFGFAMLPFFILFAFFVLHLTTATFLSTFQCQMSDKQKSDEESYETNLWNISIQYGILWRQTLQQGRIFLRFKRKLHFP